MKGKIVFIRALDHASFHNYDSLDDGDLKGRDYIEVIGKIVDEDDDYYYIVSFHHKTSGFGARYTGMKIIKKCIEEIRILEPREEKDTSPGTKPGYHGTSLGTKQVQY